MSFGDAWAQFGAANMQGQKILADLDATKADTEMRQQQAAGAKISNDTNAKMLQDKQELARWMQTNNDLKDGVATTGADMADKYTKAAQFAAQRGDFDGATSMAKLATGQLEAVGKAQTITEKAKVDTTDLLSTVAQDVQSNPNPENHKKLYQTAIAAGVAPDQIPMPGTADYGAFVNQSALASLKGAARLTYMENIRKTAEAEKDRKAAEDQRHDDAEAARKDRAVAREQTAAIARDGLEIRRQLAAATIAATTAKADRADAGGAIGHRQTVAAVNYGNEVARGLNLVADMSKGDTTGTFAHMESPTTILKSLESYGTNSLTPAKVQMLQTASKGLGLEMAQLATAGSGRSANKDVIREMDAMVAPRKGDNEFEALFKLANAADFAHTRLEAVPDSKDPKIQAIKTRAMEELKRFPHPLQIVEVARQRGYKMDAATKTGKTMRQNLDSMLQKHDAAAPPPNIQSIMDLYPTTAP